MIVFAVLMVVVVVRVLLVAPAQHQCGVRHKCNKYEMIELHIVIFIVYVTCDCFAGTYV